MAKLCELTCSACRGEADRLSEGQARELLGQLVGWELIEGRLLSKAWKFPDFAAALAFVNRVGALAESQQHHPDVHLGWGRVRIEVWTHKVKGLTQSDFILAAKLDQL
ncbi:MAG: 4a-hydroxytetrahydrobiopterin dehydratase [Planctomycetota bacterium]|nr:4a-hydroxytetrahydrobiopterin dehydratase [Planctomycetota bacterium]